ncbi:phospholipid-binding domain-containing protein [Burkholderia pseudomallei]|uniref:BON domain-containing protein n=1 Tax=Burkholderia pseudomallei TaxID=28450 RepID=UPI000537C5EE|nr:BON domain-containing protein [Burkholderia pseudomallei]AJX18374.1 BON domain protein [Burkholderia pseudomallei MSHR491]KGW87569.1 BON domain protein [Burkholderia pseudomallei MSHR449]KGX78928.1 BON domain protein [Burkholderia pseudomallei MSHR435]ONC01691.1 phospholipid-binding domain-containing protein [Burkholderia pseudomallei]
MKEMQSRVPRYTQPLSPHHAAKRFGRLATAVLIALAAACLALPQAAAAAGDGTGGAGAATGGANGPNDMTGANTANRATDMNGASSSHSTSAGTKLRDTAITTKVKAALLATNDLSSGDIHVKTRRGAVQLAGTVPDERQRTLAVDVTRQVDGVKTVRDKLTVQPK